jgi:hypothetical protein
MSSGGALSSNRYALSKRCAASSSGTGILTSRYFNAQLR